MMRNRKNEIERLVIVDKNENTTQHVIEEEMTVKLVE